jgi:isoaspartyl peptidase/L-asparaginase-like protein (Ntn-hydrolase superfamily)
MDGGADVVMVALRRGRLRRVGALPIIVSTWSFALRANEAAWPALVAGGSSLDAVETACRFAEADPDVDSVGFGGLPDRAGAVTLDAAVMTGPSSCGAVCAVSRHLHAVSIARAVMERTPYVLLAGAGADDFADEQGFPEADLVAPAARAAWEAWRRAPHAVDQSRDRAAAARPVDHGAGGPLFAHDTIGALAIDGEGRMAGACSTSGMPYKRPGRVGDSPIIGDGLYVDPAVGAATATGTGELVMGLCSSFLAVEEMRRGRSPLDALREAIERIRAAHALRPEHQVAMIALRADGTWAAAALRDGFKASVRDRRGARVTDPEFVAE